MSAGDVDMDALFARASRSIVRVETMPYYQGNDDDVADWLAGRPQAERSVRTSEYLAEVAAHAAAGVERERYRVIGTPPTDYERWELLALATNQAAGERVYVHQAVPGQSWSPDFWLIDDEIAVVFDYDLRGGLAARYTLDPAAQLYGGGNMLAVITAVRGVSEPLNTHLAADVRRAG